MRKEMESSKKATMLQLGCYPMIRTDHNLQTERLREKDGYRCLSGVMKGIENDKSLALRILNVSFGSIIVAVMLWGLVSYARLYYEDATAPPGCLSEGAFLEGYPKLFFASNLSLLLAVVWPLCYIWLPKPTGGKDT